MLNPDIATGEWRRGDMDSVATVRREAAVTGSFERKRGI